MIQIIFRELKYAHHLVVLTNLIRRSQFEVNR